MLTSKVCCNDISPLIRLFLERSCIKTAASADAVITELVEKTWGTKPNIRECKIQRFLQVRNVRGFELSKDLECDGMIEPLGSAFTDGFKIRIRRGESDARFWFTMAHEVCHTFFYELVPEVKFRSHLEDQEEERLCNLGAAVLLIPQKQLKRDARELPICLESLRMLASKYVVSLPTMLLRLKALKLWNCQLSLWHRMTNGTFSLNRLYGGKRAEWEWHEESLLSEVWSSKKKRYGRDFVYYTSRQGQRRYKPISYQLQPVSAGVMALWGSGIVEPDGALPLFQPQCPKIKAAGNRGDVHRRG